jgi:hypothetical protein
MQALSCLYGRFGDPADAARAKTGMVMVASMTATTSFFIGASPGRFALIGNVGERSNNIFVRFAAIASFLLLRGSLRQQLNDTLLPHTAFPRKSNKRK